MEHAGEGRAMFKTRVARETAGCGIELAGAWIREFASETPSFADGIPLSVCPESALECVVAVDF